MESLAKLIIIPCKGKIVTYVKTLVVPIRNTSSKITPKIDNKTISIKFKMYGIEPTALITGLRE
jgi:hypothetical protein